MNNLPFVADMDSPKDKVRARIFEFIAQDDSLLGDVWRLHRSGIPPAKLDWDSPEWMELESQSAVHLDLGETDQKTITFFNEYVADKLQISVHKADDFYTLFRAISADARLEDKDAAGCCIRLLRDFRTGQKSEDCATELDFLEALEVDLLKICPTPYEWIGPHGFRYQRQIARYVADIENRLRRSLPNNSYGQYLKTTHLEQIQTDALRLVARQEGLTPESVQSIVRLVEKSQRGSSARITPAGWRN